MKKYPGGAEVKGGFYWKLSSWELIAVEGRRGRLPDGAESAYAHVPVILFLPLALLMSALYVIFLPLSGFVIFFGLGGKRLGKRLYAWTRTLQRQRGWTRS